MVWGTSRRGDLLCDHGLELIYQVQFSNVTGAPIERDTEKKCKANLVLFITTVVTTRFEEKWSTAVLPSP